MRRRLAPYVCRLVGHRPTVWVTGTYQGVFVRVEGCPRCGATTGRGEVGSRQARRAYRRARPH